MPKPKNLPASPLRTRLLLLGLVLHCLLAHGLLSAGFELLVDLLELLDPLLLNISLGAEVGAEPALDALHAVRAQDVSALELSASAAFVERGDVLQAFAGHESGSLLPERWVSECLVPPIWVGSRTSDSFCSWARPSEFLPIASR